MIDAEWIEQISQLLNRLQRQDHSALQTLYQQTAPKLLGMIERIVNDRGEAEDVLQEVFMKVWQQSDKFSGSGSAWGWLCVLARNQALDRVRKLASRQHAPLEDYQRLLDGLIAKEASVDVHGIERCLNKLKEQPRTSILMTYVYGYSHSELVEQLSAPLGTIKSWVRRGLSELKQCLA